MGYQWLLQTEHSRDLVAFERRLLLDEPALTGSIDHYPLGEDLDAFVPDLRVREDTRLTTSDQRPANALGGFVAVAGHCVQELPDREHTVRLDRETTSLYRPEVRRADYAFTAGTRLRALSYNISPERVLAATNGRPPGPLRELLPERDRTGPAPCHRITSSPAMRRIARDVLDNRYAHELERMFIEARVLEIIVLQTRALMGPVPPETSCAARRARIRDAAALLEENLHSPPTMAGLAAAAGLSERQLQAGFRDVFGTTVFARLRDARLDAAHRALAEERIPLEEIARRVGYSNASNFANAFRRRFGFPPGQVRARIGHAP